MHDFRVRALELSSGGGHRRVLKNTLNIGENVVETVESLNHADNSARFPGGFRRETDAGVPS